MEFPGIEGKSYENNEDIKISLLQKESLLEYTLTNMTDYATEVNEIVDLLEPINNNSYTEIDNETSNETVTFPNGLETENIPHAAGCK